MSASAASSTQRIALPGLTPITPPAQTPSCWRTCFLTVIIERIALFVRDIFLAFFNIFRCGDPENPLRAEVKRLESALHQVTNERNQARAEVQQLKETQQHALSKVVAVEAAVRFSSNPSLPQSPNSAQTDEGRRGSQSDSSDSENTNLYTLPPHSNSKNKSPPLSTERKGP